MEIRKISIGPDYKSGAIHYIKRDHISSSIKIYIINKKGEIVLWKEFNQTIPTSIEFNIDF